MKCSKESTCLHPCCGGVSGQYNELIFQGVFDGLRNSDMPIVLATKIARMTIDELDAAKFCDASNSHFQDKQSYLA